MSSADDRGVITFEVTLGRSGHTPEPIEVSQGCALNHPTCLALTVVTVGAVGAVGAVTVGAVGASLRARTD